LSHGRTSTHNAAAPGSRTPSVLPLASLLAGFVLLASAHNAAVPIFEAPDEHLHYFVAQHIAQTGRLPVQERDPALRGPWEQEGSQPPLYHAMAAPILRLTGAELSESDLRYNHRNTMGEPWHRHNENRFVHDPVAEALPWSGVPLAVRLARALSTLLAAGAVLCVWAIASRVVPSRPWLAWVVAAAFAFNPQHLHLAAAMTNDNAMNLLAALALWMLLRVLDGRRDVTTLGLLALSLGLAPLAKLSGLALLGFALVTLAWCAWRERDAAVFVRAAVPVVAAALVLSGPWYARNLALYGSFTGLDYMLPEGVRRVFNGRRWVRGLPGELNGLWRSSWGIFGWFTAMLPEAVFRLLEAGTLVGLVGAGLAASKRAAWVRWGRLAWLCAWWVLAFGGLLRWLTLAKGAHGRLLFPAIAAPLLLLAVGWRTLVPERVGDRALALAASGALLMLSLFALLGVTRPAFARPPTIEAAALPADAVRVDAVFHDSLRLVAYSVPERVKESERLPVTLYWQRIGPIGRDGLVALRIDQRVADPTAGASSGGPSGGGLRTVHGDTYLAYHGRGTTPPDLLPLAVPAPEVDAGGGQGSEDAEARVAAGTAPDGPYVVDRHFPIAPPLAVPEGWTGPPQPIAARLSIHVYDAEAGESWPLTLDGTMAQDVGASVIVDPRGGSSAQAGGASGEPAAGWATAARFGDGAHEIELTIAPAGRPTLSVASVPPLAPVAVPSTGPWSIDAPLRYAPRVEGGGTSPPGGDDRLFARTGVAWRVLIAPGRDLALFTHVVDASGEFVSQADGDPASHGNYPSAGWRTGERLRADVAWSVPAGAPPGARYTVLVGLYERTPEVRRLPAWRADGERWPDDAVPLATVGGP